MEAPEPRPDLTKGQAVRHMMWDDSSHWTVLTQLYGSVWPRVFPYCVANVVMTYTIWYLKNNNIVDLTSAPSGHKYMATMMSFLVVTRVKIMYDHYMYNSQKLSDCYRAIRELAHCTCVLTARDKSTRAKEWRQDVIYNGIILLRVTMAVLEFRANPDQEPWDVPELSWIQQADIKHNLFLKRLDSPDEAATSVRKLGHARLGGGEDDRRTVLDEACRAPIGLAFNLRKEIMKQRDGKWLKKGTWDHPCNEETKLLDCVGDFLKAFSGLRVLISNPFPFPLVQMTKTFLFVWMFSLPFALCHDEYRAVNVCVIIFLITFGFFGLEFVAMELADVFGDDPSDFDNLGHAQATFEDCYIAVYNLDGEAWARRLRKKVMGRMAELDQESEDILWEQQLEASESHGTDELEVVVTTSVATSEPSRTSKSSSKKEKRRKKILKKRECVVS